MINRLLLVAMLFLASACRAIAGELTCATPQSEEEANSDRRSNYEKCFDPCEWADAAIVACKAFTELPTLANRRATAEALAMLGALYLEKHATADAMSALSGAVRLNPDLWWAYVNRGNAYMHLHQVRKAADDFDQVMRLRPHTISVLANRCWALAVLNEKLDQALSACDELLQVQPNRADVLDSRALVELRTGNMANAIKDDTAALALEPKLAGSLYVRGLAKLKSGDAAGGNADIEAAKAIDPKIIDTYAGYGVKP